jgi:hypothetical protein
VVLNWLKHPPKVRDRAVLVPAHVRTRKVDRQVECALYPLLGTSAGARLTVRRRCGNWKPALRIEARTRSRASGMARSVSPTMVKLGRPLATKGLP